MIGERIAGTAGPTPFDASDMNQGAKFGADARVIAVVSEQPLCQGGCGQTGGLIDQAFDIFDQHGAPHNALSPASH